VTGVEFHKQELRSSDKSLLCLVKRKPRAVTGVSFVNKSPGAVHEFTVFSKEETTSSDRSEFCKQGPRSSDKG